MLCLATLLQKCIFIFNIFLIYEHMKIFSATLKIKFIAVHIMPPTAGSDYKDLLKIPFSRLC